MKFIDPEDQAMESPTYQNQEIVRLHDSGLLSRSEADVFDILMTYGVPLNSSGSDSNRMTKSTEMTRRIVVSQIYISCLRETVPGLRQQITQFLVLHQPDTRIVADGMVKQGVAKTLVDNQQAIEGFLVLASTNRELHGSIAEILMESLTSLGQIKEYRIYTIVVETTFGQ